MAEKTLRVTPEGDTPIRYEGKRKQCIAPGEVAIVPRTAYYLRLLGRGLREVEEPARKTTKAKD
ncbi:MAG: hypothetical protein KC503_17370 [Myxococcales bacterium]|nr:hypothetical protein [Myxococcales bacterium]